jgi:hypothetical protein
MEASSFDLNIDESSLKISETILPNDYDEEYKCLFISDASVNDDNKNDASSSTISNCKYPKRILDCSEMEASSFDFNIDDSSVQIIENILPNDYREENDDQEYKCLFISDSSNTDDNKNDASFHTITSFETNEKIESEINKNNDSKTPRIKANKSKLESACEEDKHDFKKRIKWSEEETTFLVYGVLKYGKGKWLKILQKYKKYFNKARTNEDLFVKYKNLIKSNTLEDYEKKAKLIKEIDIEYVKYEKSIPMKWSEEELTYLIRGVKEMGNDWVGMFKKYRKHFQKNRKIGTLKFTYYKLVRNKKFDYYKRKADAL